MLTGCNAILGNGYGVDDSVGSGESPDGTAVDALVDGTSGGDGDGGAGGDGTVGDGSTRDANADGAGCPNGACPTTLTEAVGPQRLARPRRRSSGPPSKA